MSSHITQPAQLIHKYLAQIYSLTLDDKAYHPRANQVHQDYVLRSGQYPRIDL
jgi:hypothetical protein